MTLRSTNLVVQPPSASRPGVDIWLVALDELLGRTWGCLVWWKRETNLESPFFKEKIRVRGTNNHIAVSTSFWPQKIWKLRKELIWLTERWLRFAIRETPLTKTASKLKPGRLRKAGEPHQWGWLPWHLARFTTTTLRSKRGDSEVPKKVGTCSKTPWINPIIDLKACMAYILKWYIYIYNICINIKVQWYI